MKTYIKPYFKILVVLLCLSSISNIYSQVDFTPRGQANYSIKGDFTLIGNTNLTLQNYSGSTNNSNNTMIYVDEDDNIVPALPASAGTVNSSSADLVFSTENGANPICSNVLFAGLYWTGRTDGTPTDLQKRTIKFRHDDQDTYQTIVANVGDIEHPGNNNMYASYADVTNIVTANGLGTYWAADVAITSGNGGSTGYYGGWALVVVYENDQMTWRDVTIFDGYGYLSGGSDGNDILNVSGFNAVQSGPVNVKMGMVAGEGDVGISGDYFEIRNAANTAWIDLSHSGNSTNNFFNSSIQTGGNTRSPNLVNNTGLDISMFNINNAGNSIIDNGDTTTRFRFGTTQDTYIIFNIAISIDAFVPSTTGALMVNSIDGDMSVSQPYTMNPGEVVNYSLDITNNGSESLNNVQLTIPLPNTGIFNPGSISSQVNVPATTTSLPYYDMSVGPYGSILWDIGDLPLSNPEDILLSVDFDLTASTNCESFNTPTCNPIISLDASSLTGFGDVSGEPFTIKFIQGFEDSGECMGEPIREPIVIEIIPVLVIENDASPLTVECDGNGNTTEINNWLNSGGNATVVGDCVITWTNDYTSITPNSCGAGGSTTVNFVGTDSCGNTATTSALLTIEDTTPPDISNCGVTSPTLECGSNAEATADAWHADNIAALQTCPTDLCNDTAIYNITSNYNFGNLDSSASCGSTGTLTVTYFGTDDCGNTGSVIATLTIVDNTDPTWTNAPTDGSAECDGSADPSGAFAAWLLSFSGTDTCGNATVTNDSSGLTDTCGATGSETVTFTLTDDCGNAITQSATFTITDNTDPTWTNAPADGSAECDGSADPSGAFAAWLLSFSGTDTCGNATVTNDSSGLTDTCGATGSETVTFTLTDDCGNAITQSATFTITDNTDPTWTNAPADGSAECDGSADPSGAFAAWLLSFSGTDACGNATVTNDSSGLSDTCGATGSETVTFTLTDDCGNAITQSATFIITDNTNPTWTNAPADSSVECDGSADPSGGFAAWLLSFSGTDTCGNATVTNNSTGLSDACGATGSETVTFTLTDDCGNSISQSATYTIQDSIAPDLSACTVANEAVECTATDNETIADAWNLANIAELETCATDACDSDAVFTVTSDYDFNNLSTVCGPCGNITVTYTVADDCGNESFLAVTLSFGDNFGPDLSSCDVTDETIECNGTDNESIADAWNQANIDELVICADDINVTIDSDYAFTNLVTTCGAGGTILVTYTATDDCGNSSVLMATLTLNDSIGPDLSACTVVDETIECNGTDNETIANDWNAANILALQTCGTDSCDTDATFDVTSDYAFANLVTTCGAGGTITVIYTVSDDCGNDTNLTATLTLNDSIGPDLTACTVVDETIECNGTDNETIANDWNAANILALQTCGTDSCDTDATFDVVSDYAFTNLVSTCGAGGTITVIYTVSDDCGNDTNLTAILTLNDSIGPDLTACTVVDETIECNGTDNETIANDWNAANIAALQTCGTDSCDTDATFDVVSDYAFTNLVSTCGAGGTITVIYTVSDDCGNDTNLTATLTLNDSIGPDLTACTVVDETIECNGTDNETIANDWNAANIAALQTCGTDSCDTDATFDVTSDYLFTNLVTTCGAGGTITVIYTVSDDCDNDTTLTATLTLEDSIGPDLSGCNVTDEEVECTADDNETIADAWNAANIAELETCGTDSCDTDAVFTVTSDYDFNNLNTVCGPCGNLIVNYTVADDCGNTSSISATLSFGDATGPDLSSCDVTDETIECNGTDNETIADTWNANNIAELEACADDINVTITSDYAFTNLSSTCGAGGTITVTYTATDDCDNSSTIVATLTLEDSIGPDLTACTVVDETIECNGTDNESMANAWNAANILALQTCGTDSCDTDATFDVTSDYAFANLVTTCGAGGTITVTYTVADDCDNTSTLTATLTINDSTPPDLTVCSEVTDETIECNGSDNEAIADAWNQGNIDDLMVCPADDCDVDATYTVTSDYDFANLDTSSACGAGGSLPVTYTVADDCGNEATITVTLTLEDTTPPDLTVCSEVTDETIECNGSDNEAIADAWNQGNIDDLMVCPADDCDVDATYTVTSDYDFSNLDTSSACGAGGSLPVTYTVADDCGNEATITVTLTLEDTTPPDLTVCSEVTDETIECNGSDNEAIADAWNQGNIDALMVCPSDDCDVDATYTVTSDYAFSNLVSTCGLAGTITVTYTVADDCGNSATIMAILTLEDTTPPDLTSCDVVSETVECEGDDNEAIADQWNADNIAALEACASDSCDTDFTGQVTSDYNYSNLVTTCGLAGSLTVEYTVTDDCGNPSSMVVTLTIEDNTAPDLSGCDVTDEILECDGENNEAIADQWNADNIAALEACVADSCDADFTGQVTSDYDFGNLTSAPGLGGMLDVEYTITDECGNETVLYAMMTLQNTSVSANDIAICNASPEEAVVLDLFDLLDGYYDDGGTWEVIDGDATIDGSLFDPLSVEIGFYSFSYTETDSACPTYVEVTVEVHDRCFVLNCSLDNVEISKAVTPNGDMYNEFFEVGGIELCGYTIDVKLFNRWGALIYESNDYQNDWRGTAHNNSIGGADTVPDGTYYYIVTLKDSGIDPINGYIYVGTK